MSVPSTVEHSEGFSTHENIEVLASTFAGASIVGGVVSTTVMLKSVSAGMSLTLPTTSTASQSTSSVCESKSGAIGKVSVPLFSVSSEAPTSRTSGVPPTESQVTLTTPFRSVAETSKTRSSPAALVASIASKDWPVPPVSVVGNVKAGAVLSRTRP